MRRDFTYIDDIVEGIVACLDTAAAADGVPGPHQVYNLGNHRSEALMDFIGEIEKALGRKAIVELLPMQPGDVKETYADIDASHRDFGFEPKTAIGEGIPRFIKWYRTFYGV